MKHTFTNLLTRLCANTPPCFGKRSSQCALRSEGAQTKNTSLISGCSAVDVPSLSYRASDEHPMSTRSASDGGRWHSRGWKYVAMIFAVLVLSIANIDMAWGANFTPAQIVASGGTTTDNIKVSSSETAVSTGKKLCTTQTSVNAVSISNAANGDYNANYIEIKATSGTISSLSVKMRGNSDGASNPIVAVFWEGDASGTFSSKSEPNFISRTTTDCDAVVDITVPSGTKTIRLYRQIKVSSSNKTTFASSNTTSFPSSGNTFHVFGITATASGGSITPSTYTVTYDGNGKTSGTVPTDASSPYASGAEVTVLGNTGSLAKTGCTFIGWNTAANGSGESYEAGETFEMGTANVTLYAQWVLNLTTHTPGIYEETIENGGYGASLTTYEKDDEEREYETYFFSYSSSKVYVGLGGSYVTSNSTPLLPGFNGVSNGNLTSTDGWLNINAAGFSGSNTSPVEEFAVSSASNSTHYAQIQSGNSFTIKIQGYDQFSFGGRENNSGEGKQFVVKINGATQTINHSTSDWNMWRFALNPATTYTIEVSGDGANANRLRAFSLRLPAPSCSAPKSLTNGTTTYNSQAVTWTKGDDESAWEVIHLAKDATAPAANATPDATVTSASYTFTGLTASTAYDWYVRAKCGDSDKSDWVKGTSFTTDATPACAATVPGNISKGTASGGTGIITLTAAGDIASGDAWYWQSAADGTATNLGSGKTKDVNAAGTYYIRSYNTAGDCWSDAKNVTVDAADLLTAISPTLSYATSNIVVGNTSSPTLEGNTGSGSVSYALNDVSPAGSLTINSETGVVTAVTAGGTATVTATIAANGGYAGNTATSGTITAVANPLGTHTITYTLSPINTTDASLTSTQTSTSAYLKNLTTIDASLCGFASSPSKGSNRTAKINRASTEKDEDKYVYLTFDVESGYQFTPTSIVIKVANVSNATTFDASLISSDGPSVGEEEKSFSSTDGSVETWTITNEAETALTGTVTLKIWPYAASAGAFRFGTPITITGTVAAEATKYNLSFAAGAGSGTMSTLKYAEGTEVTLPACTFTAPEGKEFDAWVVTKTVGGAAISVTSNKFTMPAEAVTATATWKDATPKYNVTYDGSNETSGSVPEDNTNYSAGDAVTVAGKGDLAQDDATFNGWNTKADMTGTHYAAGANFTMPATDVTLYAEWSYAIGFVLNEGSWKSGYTAPDHYIYGKGVTLPTAANVEREGYTFNAWYSEWAVNNNGGYIDENKRTAVGTGDYGNANYLATWTPNTYDVTYTTPSNGTYTIKVGDADAVSTNTTANVGQTVTLDASPASGYGLASWTVMNGETPVEVTGNTFTMPAGNVTVSATFALEPNVYYYKSASHFDGSTYKNPEGNDAGSGDNKTLTTPWKICDACVTGVTKVEATSAVYDSKGNHMNAYIKMRKDDNGKIVFTIAENYKATIKIKMGGYSGANTNITMKLNDSGDNISYSGTMSGAGTTENGYAELTYANLAAGAYTLKPTSGSLYISQIDIQTTPVYTVTHTLTGVTTSSATKVDAGVAYSATYAAESGYALPSTITVKVGGSTIDAENYTWNQSTGALSIPAAQVTGNIQVIVVGDFTCPEAASGDVVFSCTPKASLDNADIAAGTYNLPGEWLESVSGGSAEMYVNSDAAMRIRNNQLAFNGNNAYVHLTICALAEGDRILVNSSNETNARNLLISLNTTRPADAEAAAAVIEQGKAYYISSTSPLKGATNLYIWRQESTTQVGEVSIIRSKKFTVTYAAADLTAGEVPAAVNNIFDGQTITVADQGTMEKGTMLFNGWKDANEVSYAAGADLEVTDNMTLTAQWSQLYSVTYAKAGTEEGTVPTQESLLNGAQFTVADQGSLVTPANKVFGGWNDGTQTYEAGETYTIAGADVTLTAVWNDTYTVQYDANGGEGTMADGTGTTVSIAANGFTYADHKFLRWNSQPDGEGTNYAVGAEVSENLTLYAIWKEVTCTPGTNIFSIEFTNTANVNMANGDDDKDVSSYATIVGGSALMSYFKSGSNANVLTYGSSTSKASFGTNSQYLQLNLDCALQEGDVITIVDESGNKTAIASELTDDKIPLNGTKENTSSTNTYTVLENDNIENADVLYIGRNISSGTLTFTAITIYRPLPDASVPTINNATPADAEYTGAASPMTVSADAEGAKDLHYQWYKEAGETDIEVGEDAASYTPIASGEYYCVVTNSPTGYAPQSATSRTATITMISSDATLAWLKADGNDIALSDGVYAYEYVIDDDATVAPTITAGENEENATVTITQADSKTETATVHVVAQDGETSHDYTVKFNEFSGCLTAFYFPYATDADNNHVTNNAQLRGHTVFTTTQTNSSSYTGTLTVGTDEYPATKSTGSAGNFGNLVVPEKYTATLYLLFRTGGSNCYVQLARAGETPTPYMTSDVYASQGVYQYNFENVQAGTYVIRVVKANGDVQNSNYLAMAAELCRYEVSSVSLANMILRTGNTATPEMTITPVKGAVVSQAWSFVDAATAEAAGLSINATTGAITATEDATPGAYTVKVVLNGDNTLSATCTVTVLTEYSQVDVTGTTEWDFATGKAASARIDIGYGDKLLANVDGVTNDETFNSQALMVDANYVSNSQLQSKSVMFHATVPGLLTIRYACTSGKDADRVLYINDRETTSKTKATDVIEYTQVVPAGDVTIKAMFGETPEVDIMNYKYIKFTAASELDPTKAEESTLGGYEREVNPQYYGTVCLPKAGVMTGAMLFQVAYMDYKDDAPYKVYYDEVENGIMQAGMPYIFLAEQSTIGVYYTGTAEETAKDHNGLHGTLTDITEGMNATGIYMLYNNQVLHSTNAASTLPANRAYLQISEIPGYGNPSYVAPAPKYRRISTGFNGANTATGMDEIEASETPMKVMIEGQIYIIRGEKMYDVTGKLVK